MVHRYALEVLTAGAVLAFCIVFLYTSTVMPGAEFTGSDNAGSDRIAELSGRPADEFTPLIPRWEPPSGEIESCLFALQAAIGGMLGGGVFGYWIGQKNHG